jgi:undecaprenyl diphosphate synthase
MASELLDRIRLSGDVPAHVAIIMDGNGRWARARGLPRHRGHREGMKAVREAIEGCVEAGVRILTLFAFSTENWQRPPQEVSALMSLLQLYARKERAELRRQGVEVHVLGELDRVDSATRRAVDAIVGGTRGGNELRLNLMISYGGREEILRSTRELARRAVAGEIAIDDIDEDEFAATLFTADLPASATSCSGSSRTRSCTSRRCCGRTSRASTCSRRCSTTSAGSAVSGAS